MSKVDLLQFDPIELQFPFELKKKLTCFVKLSNASDNYVAFKVKRRNLKKYRVRPRSGVVSPHSSCDVQVTMHAQKDVPLDMKCKDKFMFKSVVAGPGASDEDITAEMFDKKSGNHIEEFKLRVSYVPPPMSTADLLEFEPTELQFPFELEKQISCFLKLSNTSDEYVAFKVKATHPKKYRVRPNTGVVLPHSSYDVKVTMHAQKDVPPDMKCKDKFLVQSVVARPGASDEDITAEMKLGNQVEEHKLRVSYVPPPTSNGDILQFDPTELQFPFELNKQISCSLKLSNKSNDHVAFKVSTTNPKNYCVRPNSGVILPGSTCDVSVTMQRQKDAPLNLLCKDKFKIQSVAVNPGISRDDITEKLKLGNQVEEHKLRVSYVPPPTSNGDLLQFDPTELQFPFESNKHISCSLKLSSKSNDHVAFKISTTNPKDYCVRPNRGVILPRSTCDVLVTMQGQKVAPTNLLCKDKFKIQSVVVNPGTSADDITQKLFTKEPENHVEEGKLRVSYGPPPQPPSLVQEGSEGSTSPNAREVTEEVLSPKVSDKYSVNASVFKSAKLKASDWRGKLSENMQKLFGTGEATGVNGVVAKTGAWRKIAAHEQEQLLKGIKRCLKINLRA